jgi:tripartite-type tricarboxylate transporter receptor subunit TctC
MTTLRRKSAPVALAVAVALSGAAFASNAFAADKKAESYPCDPIEIISHASPGGGTDTTARMMMIRSRRYLKTDMVVVYKRGGGARAALEYFNKRPADGCTVMAVTPTHFNTIAEGHSPVTAKDMIGVARAMDDPMFLVVNTKSKFKTIDDIVAASKKKPLNWGGGQILSTDHIAVDKFAKATGIPYKYVPYGSAGPVTNDLLGMKVDIATLNVSEAAAQVEEGNFAPLVVLAKKRLKDYPDVPTAQEKGWNVLASTVRGYVVKKGTPPDRVAALEKAMVKAMKHKVFAGYLKSAGLNPDDSVVGTEEWTAQLQDLEADAIESVERMKKGAKK